MSPVDRIGFLVLFYRTTVKAFAKEAGLDRPQVLYDIQNGKTKSITDKLANKIVSEFCEINKEWLLSGCGEPFESAYARIRALLRREKITYKDLEKGSNMAYIFTRGRIFEHAEKNNTDAQVLNNWIETLLERFKYYSKDWILTGEGSIFSDGRVFITPGSSSQVEMQNVDENQSVPLYDYYGNTGLASLLNERTQPPSSFLSIPHLPPVDGAIRFRGDSMSPLIKSGDIVMYKKKDPSSDSFLWGEIYILSVKSGEDSYTTLRYVQQSTNPGMIRLVGYNPSFEAIDVPVESITALALIKASLIFHTME